MKNKLLHIIFALGMLLASLLAGAQTNSFRVLGGVPHLPVLANTAAVTTPAAGMVIYSTADAKPMVYTGSAWDTFCTSAVFGAGQATFQVVGGIPYLPARASLTVTPAAGNMYYSSANAAVMVYDGGTWRKVTDLSAGSYTAQTSFASLKEVVQLPVLAADPAPAGLTAGAIYISSAGKAIKWYNGTAWQSVSCNAAPVVTAINVTGCTLMGQTLTVDANVVDPEGDALLTSNIRWYYNNTTIGNGTAIPSATATTYTLASPVVLGNYVRVAITPIANVGTSPGIQAFSSWVLVGSNSVPYFTSVGNNYCYAKEGQNAYASSEYADCESDPAGQHLYQWTRSNDAYGTGEAAISGATASSYTFTSTDIGKYLRVWVTPVATAGQLTGAPTASTTFIGPILSNDGSSGTLLVNHYFLDPDGVDPVSANITYSVVATNRTGSPTCWIAQNLGASQQASSFNDASAASSGWYWQYGTRLGYVVNNAGTRTPNSAITLAYKTSWAATDDPCTLTFGAPWRVPTRLEWIAVASGPDMATPAGAYASELRLHASGKYRSFYGIEDRGTKIYYLAGFDLATGDYCWFNSYYNTSSIAFTCESVLYENLTPVRCLKPLN